MTDKEDLPIYLVKALLDPSPCDQCALRVICGENEVACRLFYAWSRLKESEDLPRLPNRRVFLQVFSNAQRAVA